MDTYTTESMIQNCSLTGQQFREIKGMLLAQSNVLMELHANKLKDLEKGPEPFFKVYKYCTQGKDPEKVKLWTTGVCEEMEHTIYQRYCEMIEESKSKGKKHWRNTAKELAKTVPVLDYDLPPLFGNGPTRRGVTALQGGDHGNVSNLLPVPSVLTC
jgi:hypothetical protein